MPDLKVSQELERLAKKIRRCPKCPLCESRLNAVPGDGAHDAKLMIIGEAPGRQEDEVGRPFVGSAGKYLDQVLAASGIDRSQIFVTNTVKCRPPKNRVPTTEELSTCTSNYLFKQIDFIKPTLILLLGGTALKVMLGVSKIEDSRGRVIAHNGNNFWVTYHPASRFYNGSLAKKIDEDLLACQREFKRLSGTSGSNEKF